MKIMMITAILCITAIEIFALYKGVNGTILTVVVGALAGIAGYKMAKET